MCSISPIIQLVPHDRVSNDTNVSLIVRFADDTTVSQGPFTKAGEAGRIEATLWAWQLLALLAYSYPRCRAHKNDDEYQEFPTKERQLVPIIRVVL